MSYSPLETRYSEMKYNKCGKSGLKLSAISLGLWHNFGGVTTFENSRQLIMQAFDLGITHFDIANNYGPPPGSVEENFGKILRTDLKNYRDELIISTKAGYYMWPGPYGDWGSKKYMTASLDQSLKRLGLDYVDIYYHHRPDPNTPIHETMAALDLIVKQGKALYVGISNYKPKEAIEAIRVLNQLGTPCLIHQPRYSMLERWVESELLDVLDSEGVGCIPFSPLAKGLLTNRYLNGIPSDSRAASQSIFLKEETITEDKITIAKRLDEIAKQRGQTLAQMALAWILNDRRITSVLIGASKKDQIKDCCDAIKNTEFTDEELKVIDSILG